MILRSRASLALITAAAVLTLAGCSGAPQAPAQTESAAPATITPQPGTGSAPPEAEAEPPAPPTCDNIIPQSLIDHFTSAGLAAQPSQIYGADGLLPESLMCTWGDTNGNATDAVQQYGWALIDADTAKAMQDRLVEQGWTREDDGDLVYITTTQRSPVLDENGYGMTYRFAQGWLTYADTKQGLLLITWPK